MPSHEQPRHWGFGASLRLAAPVVLAATLVVSTGCDMIAQFTKPGPEVVEGAHSALRSGDLPAAADEFARLAADHPEVVEVAVGHAYMQLLAGDTRGADATLAAVEPTAGDDLGKIKLRRALVALNGGDLDGVKSHGKASGLPEGKLLAAEVHLVDLESDEAMQILREVSGAGGPVGDAAGRYLSMLDSGDQIQAGLAEATALWALGERESSCEAAEELVKALGDDGDKNAQLLLWAGRAVTSGLPGVATSLLDDIDFPPEGQAWRVQATRAMVSVAEGDVEEGARILSALEEAGAPADGLADAMATACGLTDDRSAAKELAGRVESAAAARCLLHAGAGRAAMDQAPPGALKTFLENR
ncbi:MAG: hypothetical protein ACI8PZ_005845 [Myxococcota bacterium]|jgi:hypothetical protein